MLLLCTGWVVPLYSGGETHYSGTVIILPRNSLWASRKHTWNKESIPLFTSDGGRCIRLEDFAIFNSFSCLIVFKTFILILGSYFNGCAESSHLNSIYFSFYCCFERSLIPNYYPRLPLREVGGELGERLSLGTRTLIFEISGLLNLYFPFFFRLLKMTSCISFGSPQ